MAASRLDLRPYGDRGVLAGVVDDDYETRWGLTQTLSARLREVHPPWLVDVVATYDHLFVDFDPGLGDHDDVQARLQELYADLGDRGATTFEDGRTFEVPVLFGGEAGPDLEDVARELDLTPEALVERLTAIPWRLRFVASPVGTPFTDREDWDVTVPRVPVPRVAVPPGSVALSGSQSIIYPVRSPGGWRLVGQTPLRLVSTDPDSGRLVAYRAGDRLRYVPVDPDRFAELERESAELGEPR